MRGRILVQQLAEVLSLEIMRLPANLDASGFKFWGLGFGFTVCESGFGLTH